MNSFSCITHASHLDRHLSHATRTSQQSMNESSSGRPPPSSSTIERGRGHHRRGRGDGQHRGSRGRARGRGGANSRAVVSGLTPDLADEAARSSIAPTPSTRGGGHRGRGARIRAPTTIDGDASLSARIAHELSQGDYECCVCMSAVSRQQPIHNCDVCSVVTHLKCVADVRRRPAFLPCLAR